MKFSNRNGLFRNSLILTKNRIFIKKILCKNSNFQKVSFYSCAKFNCKLSSAYCTIKNIKEIKLQMNGVRIIECKKHSFTQIAVSVFNKCNQEHFFAYFSHYSNPTKILVLYNGLDCLLLKLIYESPNPQCAQR